MLSTSRRRDLIEAAYIQMHLHKNGYRLIFVDEFHISMKSVPLYNWSKRGEPASLSIDSDPFTMSFVVGVSSVRLEGILAWNESITTKTFWWFIGDIWNRFHQNDDWSTKLCFIFDNASLHCSSTSQKFMKEKGIKWISIPPYSPQPNPAEKAIALIKSRLKWKWIQGKPFSLKSVKEIVDEITEITWRKWIHSSWFESFLKINQLNFQSSR